MSPDASVEMHLDALLSRVGQYREKVAALAPDAELHVICSIYAGKFVRIKFDRSLIGDLSALGVTFGVDVYVLPDGDDDSEATGTMDAGDVLYQDTDAYLSVASALATREGLSSTIGTEGDLLALEDVLVGDAKSAGSAPVWLMRSLLPKSVEPELHIDNVLQRSRKFADKVLEVSRRHEVCVWCLVKTNDRIVLELDPAHTKGISRLGAGFGLECWLSL